MNVPLFIRESAAMPLHLFCHHSCQHPCAIVLLLFFSTALYTTQACTVNEHHSLLRVLHTLNASSFPLPNLTSTLDCCRWEGITCDPNSQVTHLSLPSKGLSGTISPFLKNLTHLSHLNLSHNRLSGQLPDGFFDSLRFLEIFDISSNDLVGKFPSSYPQSTRNLVLFNISHNGFSGPLPTSGFGASSELEDFDAGFNGLSGQVPKEIYGALRLKELRLPSNNLTGSIDSHLANLSNLTILDLHSNTLSGNLPGDVGKLYKLETLLLQLNNFSGTLPASLFSCTNLKQLNLLYNSFQGNMTEMDFSKLSNLTILDLGSNSFTGQLPKSFYSCKSLKAIRLSQNNLGGQISPNMLALQSLTFLAVSATRLTNISGTIQILMGLKNLTVAAISGNFKNEALPIHVDPVGFQNLRFLSITGCQLTGQVPTWLRKLHKLRFLDLGQNQLSGTIPEWLGTLQSLAAINLHGNLLHGEFPRTLTTLPALIYNSSQADQSYLDLPIFCVNILPKFRLVSGRTYNQISNIQPRIDLGNNTLCGSIPTEIGRLKRLVTLVLSKNEFSGQIPNQISALSNLETLDLSHNDLSGEIPQSLGNLNFLSHFNVSFNNLWGRIPQATQMQGLDASAFGGNAGLCGPPLSTCNHTGNHPEKVEEGEDDDTWWKEVGIYVSVWLGFVVGFWGVVGSLWMNPGWRSACFRSVGIGLAPGHGALSRVRS